MARSNDHTDKCESAGLIIVTTMASQRHDQRTSSSAPQFLRSVVSMLVYQCRQSMCYGDAPKPLCAVGMMGSFWNRGYTGVAAPICLQGAAHPEQDGTTDPGHHTGATDKMHIMFTHMLCTDMMHAETDVHNLQHIRNAHANVTHATYLLRAHRWSVS